MIFSLPVSLSKEKGLNTIDHLLHYVDRVFLQLNLDFDPHLLNENK